MTAGCMRHDTDTNINNLKIYNSAMTRYGYNRDWRRYNEDQRIEASDIQCGCNDEPKCKPLASPCEYPPYLGQRFGARYMAWSHPTRFMFPQSRPFHWQSTRKC